MFPPPTVSVMSTNVWKSNTHGFKSTVSKKFGTVPNIWLLCNCCRGGRRGKTVPFLTHLEKYMSVYFSVLHQRSDSVPGNWNCLWKHPHDQIPDHLPLPGVTEQDLCTLSFLRPHSTLFASLLLPTRHFHFPSKHARGLTSHHTEKQLTLCSPSPSLLAKWRLEQVGHKGNTLHFQFPEKKCWEKGILLCYLMSGRWHCQEQAGAWTQLFVLEEHKSSTLDDTTWLLSPTIPASAVTIKWKGEQKTRTNTSQSCLSVLSSSFQKYIVQGFFWVKQAIFGHTYRKPVHRTMQAASFFPSCESWLQGTPRQPCHHTPTPSPWPSSHPKGSPHPALCSHSPSLPMTPQTQLLCWHSSGHTAWCHTECPMALGRTDWLAEQTSPQFFFHYLQ